MEQQDSGEVLIFLAFITAVKVMEARELNEMRSNALQYIHITEEVLAAYWVDKYVGLIKCIAVS